MILRRIGFLVVIVLIFAGCSDSSSNDNGGIPYVYNKIYGASSVTLDGEFIVIKSKGVPDHKSPYYDGDKYTPYTGPNSSWAPVAWKITEQNLTFRIPLHPVAATSHPATPTGPIGIAVNGVPFYNQFGDASASVPLTSESPSFDQFNGITQSNGSYHYHIEPVYVTDLLNFEALMGFMLDGFPIYGPKENGSTVSNAMLDAHHGHFGVTADYINGIYHYHITATEPYFVGDGFNGTPGTVTQ